MIDVIAILLGSIGAAAPGVDHRLDVEGDLKTRLAQQRFQLKVNHLDDDGSLNGRYDAGGPPFTGTRAKESV